MHQTIVRCVEIIPIWLLGEELLYLLGVGAGEAVGDGYLSAVGLDDNVRKEQTRFERDAANAATLDNRGGIADEAGFVERNFLLLISYFGNRQSGDCRTSEVWRFFIAEFVDFYLGAKAVIKSTTYLSS